MIENVTKEVILAENAESADTFISRQKGLLGRKEFQRGEAMVIEPCTGIHTLGMKFSIDVLFLDGTGRVIGMRKGVTPYHFTPFFWRAERAVELPVSTIDDSRTDIGDLIRIEEISR